MVHSQVGRAALFIILMSGLSGPAAIAQAPADPPSATVGNTPEQLRPVKIPDDLASKITDAQRAFVESGHATRFVKPDDFFARIRKSQPADIEAYLAALHSIEDSVDFKPGRDKATIPMDKSSPEYNAW